MTKKNAPSLVVENKEFAQSELELEAKKNLDMLFRSLSSKPTGYFIATFAEKGDMVRAYNFTKECEVNAWTFPSLVKQMMR